MTLEEGLNLEKRFFHQTFGTVSMVPNKITCILRILYGKLKVMILFHCNDNLMQAADHSDGQVMISQVQFGIILNEPLMPNVFFFG